MGTDIHGVVEKKSANKWVAVNTLCSHNAANRQKGDLMNGWSRPVALDRNYPRFGALAGVRNTGPAPRGMPENISETTAFLIAKWEGDGHSHSWLPLPEAAQIMANTEYWRDNEGPDDFVRKYPVSFFFGIEDEKRSDYRFVFWFDN